jgi:hypothetical protein
MSPNYVWSSKYIAGSCNTWFHTAVVSTATPTLRQRYIGNEQYVTPRARANVGCGPVKVDRATIPSSAARIHSIINPIHNEH